MRSTRSSGISGIVEAVRGEGRTGRVGFVSILKDLIKDNESGMGAPLVLNGELGPPRFRLMVIVLNYVSNVCAPPILLYHHTAYGRRAVWPARRRARPGLQTKIDVEMC